MMKIRKGSKCVEREPDAISPDLEREPGVVRGDDPQDGWIDEEVEECDPLLVVEPSEQPWGEPS